MAAADGMISRERSVGADALQGFGQHGDERFDVLVQAVQAAFEAQDQGSPDLLEGMGTIDMPGALLGRRQALLSLMANGLDDVVQQDFGLNFLLDGLRKSFSAALQRPSASAVRR